MFQVSGLPIQITKSDLDELFKDYGEVQTWSIHDQSIVFVQLDKNEELAISALDRTEWRDKYFLHLDPIRGDGNHPGQRGSGGNGNGGTGSGGAGSESSII